MKFERGGMTDVRPLALVTGAASGIGTAVAERLVCDGARVLCVDIDAPAVDRVASRLGPSAEPVHVDLADTTALHAVVDRLRDRFDVLDILVNNAGISDTTPTEALDLPTFRRLLDVNLMGAVDLTLALLPALRASAAGRVVNVASVQGLVPAADTLAYATSKGALITFTRGLATDLAAYGVLVNAVAPGFIDTPMARLPSGEKEYDTDWFRNLYVGHGRLPLRRPGAPSEVAAAVAFLASAENTYITGQVLAVDGGLTSTF